MQKHLMQMGPPSAGGASSGLGLGGSAGSAGATELKASGAGAGASILQSGLAAKTVGGAGVAGRTVGSTVDSLIKQRAEARDQVIRESNGPTMTMDEWIAAERCAGILPPAPEKP